jgi:Flp pilus assembly protein TadG
MKWEMRTMTRLIHPISSETIQGPARSPRPRAERAQGMVEFALVLPLLLLLVFGIIELGRLMVIYTSVAAASREGARYGSAAGTSDNGVPYYLDTAGIQAAVRRMTVLTAPDSIIITYDHGPGTAQFTPTTSGDVRLRDRINVTVTALYDPILGLTPIQPFTISSTTSRTIVKEVAISPGTGGSGGGSGLPTVDITFPTANPHVVEQGETIDFTAVASDPDDGDLTASIEWLLDGEVIGSCSGGDCLLSTIPPGTHIITARVTDSSGNLATDSVSVFIDPPPTVGIWTPHDGDRFEQGEEITFLGFASEMFEGDLSHLIQWYDNGVLLASNTQTFVRSDLPAGLHTITASVTDSDGQTASVSLTIVIEPRTPPNLVIVSPVDGAYYARASAIAFSGVATDAEDGDISASIVWSSDLDGVIGTGANVSSSTLRVGTHVITASVTDSDGMTTTLSISIRVVDDRPPVVTILSPTSGASYNMGVTINFSGTAIDATDGNLTSQLVWRSSIDGQIGTGGSFSYSRLTPGVHTIIATVTDSDGLTGSASVVIYVIEHNDPPTITIDAPANNAALVSTRPINFRGTANDPQQGLISDLIRWASSINGSLGTGASITTTLSTGFHTITATVTDAGGLSASATIRITVWQPVCPSPGTTVWSYQNSNFADKVSWFLTIPSGVTQTQPYVMDYLRIALDNTSAAVSSITIEGIPVPSSRWVINGTILEVFGPVWTGYFRANNTIEVIIDFQPKPRRGSDGPFTLMTTFQGCSSIQTITRP